MIMEWFDKWFQYQCEKAWNAKHNDNPVRIVAADNMPADNIIDNTRSYIIKMQPAHGGTILEVSHYDKRQDEYNRDLYIIEQDKDVGKEISSILVQYRLTHT